jgi:hypothetical protein
VKVLAGFLLGFLIGGLASAIFTAGIMNAAWTKAIKNVLDATRLSP